MIETAGWLACVIYSTIPAFWLLIHPWAAYWRSRRWSPYRALVPVWIALWIVVTAATAPWHHVVLYAAGWSWLPAIALFSAGIWIYRQSGKGFSAKQLGGLPEILPDQHDQRLIVSGIRARVRHPVYLAHLCEMLAWSLGTGLVVCYGLTAFAILTGAVMIRLEDNELEHRFGSEYAKYRRQVAPLLPLNKRTSHTIWLVVLAGVSTLALYLSYAFLHRDQIMIFQHGTPEVPSERAFVVLNPFRSRMPERTAVRLIRDLRTENCETIVRSMNSETWMCVTLRQNVRADLIWREDRPNGRSLVYYLPDSRSNLWIHFTRDEAGFGISSVSLIR